MTEEEYFARFAAALFAAYRTDSKPTEPRRDIVRALSEARMAALVAFKMKDVKLDDVPVFLDNWHDALKAP